MRFMLIDDADDDDYDFDHYTPQRTALLRRVYPRYVSSF